MGANAVVCGMLVAGESACVELQVKLSLLNPLPNTSRDITCIIT